MGLIRQELHVNGDYINRMYIKKWNLKYVVILIIVVVMTA